MFKDRTYLIIALAVVILALGVSARFYWHRSVPGIDRGVPCKWDPNQLGGKPDTCEGQCIASYFGGTKNGQDINGKAMHFCCSKGWTAMTVDDPIRHQPVDVICRKD
jgi:hypothetical protein